MEQPPQSILSWVIQRFLKRDFTDRLKVVVCHRHSKAALTGRLPNWRGGKLEIYIQPRPLIRHMSFHDTMDALDTSAIRRR